MDFKNILSQIDKNYPQARDKGDIFENLIIEYLKHEPFYGSLYKQVLKYSDWVKQYNLEDPKQDNGVDLVAVTYDDKFHAIQCKFRQEDNTISKRDIDSFIAFSGKQDFASRILISTTNKFSDNAKYTIKDQEKPIIQVSLNDLDSSQIDWSAYSKNKEIKLKPVQSLRAHQKSALEQVVQGLENTDRGKMIMACGTGKTLTALHIAHKLTGNGKRVLFLVPSLSLMSQIIKQWTQNSENELNNYAVCSDAKVGKNKQNDDLNNVISDLKFPATTNPKSLYNSLLNTENKDNMTVIYATYHSIEIIKHLQTEYNFGEFDLIICDEAHRTAGYTFVGEAESCFTRVHDNDYIQAKKRLYMTATPKVYAPKAKQTQGVELCSMDDEQLYGKELYKLTFSQAVEQNLLVDYKVIVLSVDEAYVSEKLNNYLSDDATLKVSDAGKIIGCWKALSGHDLRGGEGV